MRLAQTAGCATDQLDSCAVMLTCNKAATNIARIENRLETDVQAVNRNVVALLFVIFCSLGKDPNDYLTRTFAQ